MGDKVALPSLSLPKQRTHWSVFVVVAAGVMFLLMCAALYLVLERQQKAEEAFAKRQEDHRAELKAKADMDRAAAERAAAEAKKKQAETAAAAAAAAAAKRSALAKADDEAAKSAYKRASARRSSSSKSSSKSPVPAGILNAAPAPAPPPKQQSKASKDIDDLLRGFK
jgi:biopolymer transport protein ExbB/TolQ